MRLEERVERSGLILCRLPLEIAGQNAGARVTFGAALLEQVCIGFRSVRRENTGDHNHNSPVRKPHI